MLCLKNRSRAEPRLAPLWVSTALSMGSRLLSLGIMETWSQELRPVTLDSAVLLSLLTVPQPRALCPLRVAYTKHHAHGPQSRSYRFLRE